MDSHAVRGSLALLQNLINRRKLLQNIMKAYSKYNIGDEVSWERCGKEKRGIVEYIQINLEANKYESHTSVSYTIRGFDDTIYVIYEDNLQ